MKTLRRTTPLTLVGMVLLAAPAAAQQPVVDINGNMGVGTLTPNTFKLEVGGSLGPATNDLFNLGSNDRRFSSLFIGPSSLHMGTPTSEGIIGYDPLTQSFLFDPDGDGVPEAIMDVNGNIAIGTSNTFNPLTIEGDADQIVLRRKTTSPNRASMKLDLLSESWDLGIVPGIFFIDAAGVRKLEMNAAGDLTITGNFLPSNNNNRSLGSTTQRWNDLFLGPNSLHLGNSSGDEGIVSYTSAPSKRLLFDADGNAINDAAKAS